MAKISPPEAAARYQNILSQKDTDAVQEYFAINEPRSYSTLRTSISPNIFKGGYLRNVIPSEAEATLDIRALPDEEMPALLEQLRRVINDPAIEVARVTSLAGPALHLRGWTLKHSNSWKQPTNEFTMQ